MLGVSVECGRVGGRMGVHVRYVGGGVRTDTGRLIVSATEINVEIKER